jgi:hypothetical protein
MKKPFDMERKEHPICFTQLKDQEKYTSFMRGAVTFTVGKQV